MMEQFSKVFSSFMIVRKKILVLGLVIILVEILNSVDGLKAGFWNYLDRNDDDSVIFQQVTVDNRTGEVFVAGKNTVLKLTGLLAPMARYRTGPVLDGGPPCPLEDTTCGQEPRAADNNAKVLEIDSTFNRLVFCGSGRYGLCSSLSTADLKGTELNASDHSNYLAGTGTVYAFYGTNVSGTRHLHVASSYDGRPLDQTTWTLASVTLRTGSNSDSSYRLQSVAGFDFEASAKSRYVVRYVYGFEHEQFLYFLTVQRQSILDDYVIYETRLARVCLNDSSIGHGYGYGYSYTEVTLNCRQKTSVATFLNVAQAAHLAPMGAEFSKGFGYSKNELALFVLMAKGEEGSWVPDPSYGSGLCVFAMTDVRKAFKTAQSDCYLGYGSLLPWVTYMEPKCTENYDVYVDIDDNFCGNSLNVGVGSRYPLTTDTNFTIDDHVGTSLSVIVQRKRNVAIVGTNDGHLLKVLVDGRHSGPYLTLDIAAGLGSRYPVAPDMALDPTQKYLYVLNGPQITRVPLYACAVYDDCASCISTPDPLGCGWCDDHCSTKDQCTASWSNDFCQPVIHSFHPRSGPVGGGTRMTIVGTNFGSGSGQIEGLSAMVKVAMTDCTIEFHNNSHIVCLTGRSVRGPVEREVKVSVIDLSKTAVTFDIRGSVSTMREVFAYKVPSVVSVVPLVGPKSGGTQLTISGQHLDIGAQRSVAVGSCPCSLVRVSAAAVVCNTSAFCTHNSSIFLSSSRSAAVSRSPVAVSIDGFLLSVNNSVFVYVDDPVIVNVFPRISFLSGGIPVTVTGSNLHITQLSSLCVEITSEAHTFCSNCFPNENGSLMICRSPNVTLSNPVLIDDRPLEVKYLFNMDGIRRLTDLGQGHQPQNVFRYYIDPVPSAFTAPRLFYDDEINLEILGNHLNLAASEIDYRVTVGGVNCSVVRLTSVLLLCRPEKREMVDQVETYKAVQVSVGNLVYAVGFLQYAKRRDNTLVIATAAPVAGMVCILTLIVFAVWICRACARHRKSKDRISFIEVENARVGTIAADIGLDQIEPQQLDPFYDVEILSILLDCNMLIDNDNLTILDVIGQGHFGCVYRGLMQTEAEKELKEVAVKTLKVFTENAFVNAVEARKFVDEALRMREFNHPHVLRVIGISLSKDNAPLVILPFMKHGDLLSYLRNEENSPTVRDLLEFCVQIADGVAYLANLKFVHRDLAARNCMLDDCMQVKVADFGLSRDIYERDYYSSDDHKARMPVKWMAIESLEKGIYNTKTDVWSYGIVLWELMTRGICPYPDVDNWDVLNFLRSGRRLSQPPFCPVPLYQMMLSCWNPVSGLRPSFSSLKLTLLEIINSMESHQPSRSGTRVVYVNTPECCVDYLVPDDERERE